MMVLIWMGVACQGPAPDATEVGDPSCVEAAVADEGLTLELGPARLDLAPGVVPSGVTVELCREGADDPAIVTDVWWVGPANLEWSGAGVLTLMHDASDGTAHLFVPDPDRRPTRSLLPERPEPGVIRGSMYRPGRAWVQTDPRVSQRIDTTAQPEDTDILWVVDNSSSMAEHQERLTARAGDLFDALVAQGVNFHLGVTTTDLDDAGRPGVEGLLREVDGLRWIERDTPDAVRVLQEMIDVGTEGSTAETGSGAAWTALELRTRENTGFRRPEAAHVAVVVFTDEDDDTPAHLISVSEFVEWMSALPGRFYGIADLGSSGGYQDLSESTDGYLLSIQDPDWDLGALAADMVLSVPRIEVPGPIDIEALEVWRVPSGEEPTRVSSDLYTFDRGTLTVTLSPAIETDDDLLLLYELR